MIQDSAFAVNGFFGVQYQSAFTLNNSKGEVGKRHNLRPAGWQGEIVSGWRQNFSLPPRPAGGSKLLFIIIIYS